MGFGRAAYRIERVKRRRGPNLLLRKAFDASLQD
jgi:hypothetical protein